MRLPWLVKFDEPGRALEVIQGVAEEKRTEALCRYEVYCTARVGDEVTTLQRARDYRAEYGFDPDVLHTELDALVGDPSTASQRVRPGERC